MDDTVHVHIEVSKNGDDWQLDPLDTPGNNALHTALHISIPGYSNISCFHLYWRDGIPADDELFRFNRQLELSVRRNAVAEYR